MANPHWTRTTLETRIADPLTRRRHSAGSPNETEIAAYKSGLHAGPTRAGIAVVLGMTPELRTLALAHFDRVCAVDCNPHSIALYRDWVDPRDQARETILEADWLSLPALLAHPVDAVLGDGVFANLPDAATHERLLGAISTVLAVGGRFVTRTVIIPRGFNPVSHEATRLLARFRAHHSDEAEFGFDMRFVGHYRTCYDPHTGRLDNAKFFARCEARHQAGELTDTEYAAIRRYYFSGTNCILSQQQWEQLLVTTGWRFRIHPCHGKSWYAYYPVYACGSRRSLET